MNTRFFLAVLALAVATTACAKPPKATPLMITAEPVAIVLATAIIAPESLVAVVTDAVKASPMSAIPIVAAAVAGAPDQALAIRAAAVAIAPLDVAEIVRVTMVKRRTPVVTHVRIQKPEEMLALLERAAPQ